MSDPLGQGEPSDGEESKTNGLVTSEGNASEIKKAAQEAQGPDSESLKEKLSKATDPAMKRLYTTILGGPDAPKRKRTESEEEKEDSEGDEDEEEEEEEEKRMETAPKPQKKKRRVVEDLTAEKMEIAKGILINDWELLKGDLKQAAARVCYRGGFDLFKWHDAEKVVRLIRQMRRQYNVRRIPGQGWTNPS